MRSKLQNPRWRALFLALLAAGGGGVGAFVARRASQEVPSLRGRDGSRAELRVFRLRPEGAQRLVDRFAATDELAFAYRNGVGTRHLFVFGVDEHRHVFWYAPAWTSADQDPPPPQVKLGGAFQELENAVRHDYDGARLELHALFTDRPWRVRELEAIIAGTPPGNRPSFGELPVVQVFEVTR